VSRLVARETYHHGQLREALVVAGLELTRAGGPTALGLRDVTRRVGVTPNAAYRHFADRESLLAAVAERIQADMVARMATIAAADPRDPVADLRAVGLGYVEFALAEPGWFRTAFAMDGAPASSRSTATAVPPPFARLVAALDALVVAGQLPPDRRVGAEWPCWSAVHGVAVLALGGPLLGQPPEVVQAAVERTVDAVIAGVLSEDVGAPGPLRPGRR